MSALTDGVAVTDEGGIVQSWNEVCARLTGVSHYEAVGRPLWEVQRKIISTSSRDGKNSEQLQAQIQEMLQTGKSVLLHQGLESEVKLSDGKRRTLRTQYFPLKTAAGFALACITREMEKPRHNDQLTAFETTALEAAANGIAITDRNGEFLWVNPAFSELTGYLPEEVQGKTFRMLKSGQQRDEVYKALWETVLRGEVWKGELVNRRKDGSLYIEEQIITPVRDERGEISHFIAIMQDVTQRKVTEEALHESERRFSEILETIKLVAVMLDMHGTVIYCNRFLLQLTGWERDEVLGKHWFSTFLPPEIQKQEEKRFLSRDIPSHYENEIVTRSGEVRTIAWNNTFIHDGDGNRISTTSIGEDITERKKAESEIARLAAVVEQIEEGVLITDLNQKILYVNPYYEDLTGFSKADLIGIKYQMLHSDRAEDNQYSPIWNEVKVGSTWKGTLISTRKDGSQFHEETSFFPIRNLNDEVINFAAVGRDITARVEAEEQIQLQMRRLAALRSIDLAITSSLDVRVVLNVLLDQVVTQLDVDAAALLLMNPHTQLLEFAGGRGFRKNTIQQTRLRLGQGLPGTAALERRPISVPNFAYYQDKFLRAPLIAGEDFTAYYSLPLIAKGQVKGVLEIFNRSQLNPDAEWLNFLDTLAGQAAIAIDNATLLADLQRSNEELAQAYVTTLEGWVRTLGLRDDETEEHAQRVTLMTLRLAGALGINNGELLHIRRGALLHDIGKMAVPDHILLKSGPLEDDEWEIMRRHPVDAFELLSPITYLRPALDIPYCHHEKWDGTGYPRGLKGEEIPLAARLFAVADVWDALRSDRPYRKAWPEQKAIQYLREQEGKHFDPRVMEAFFTACATDDLYQH